ncbi:MAG: TlyA family RNA methyltransferase [Nitrospirae bacterium]|nr:TlyA family RNA methyltransferase [Nitrospirota bacterium]
MKQKDRLDKIIVDRSLVKSRDRAKALIMAGNVLVDGKEESKAGALVDINAVVALRENDIPFVSRGGIKLEGALEFSHIDLAAKIVMDIGSSTGGFTDCVLKRGAARVYAIDVGYGQLDWSLRNDPRVILLEKTNIRHLEADRIPEPIDLVVIDVSFISLTQVLPRVLDFLGHDGDVLALVKPQFEVGKGMVDKGGVIRDESKRLAAVKKVSDFSAASGFIVMGDYESPLPGQKGNREYFIHLRRKNHG